MYSPGQLFRLDVAYETENIPNPKRPRQAALKAVNRGEGTKSKPEFIRLRERRTKKVHVFKEWKQTVKAPEKGLNGYQRK